MHLTRRSRIYDLSPDKYLVCNALTGEVSLVGSAVYRQIEALKENHSDECSMDILRALKDRKLVFESSEDEDAAFRALIEEAYSQYLQRSHFEYCFAVNTHCNFNCVYCFEPEAVRASAATLSEKQLDAAFRIVDDAEAAQPSRPEPDFTLYGGEPLLRPSKAIVMSLIQRIAARGHRASIISNGYTLASFFDVFDAFHHDIESVQITVDGTEMDHNRRRVLKGGAGTFAKIVANIDAFLSRGYDTRCLIRTSFDEANLHRVSELKRWLDGHGWSQHPRVSVIPVTIQDHKPCGSMEGLIGYCDLLEGVFPYSTDCGDGPFTLSSIPVLGHVRNYLGLAARGVAPIAFSPRAAFCGAGVRLWLFHPDGRIYPCYEAVGQPKVAIGRYYPVYSLDRSMEEQWSGVRLLEQPECFDCSISTFCGGGCASGALAKKGQLNAAFCEGAHEVFDRYFELIRKEYSKHSSTEQSPS
jgi:uncharacterized protein